MLVQVCLRELRGLSGLTAPLYFVSRHGDMFEDGLTRLQCFGPRVGTVLPLWLSCGRGSQFKYFTFKS